MHFITAETFEMAINVLTNSNQNKWLLTKNAMHEEQRIMHQRHLKVSFTILPTVIVNFSTEVPETGSGGLIPIQSPLAPGLLPPDAVLSPSELIKFNNLLASSTRRLRVQLLSTAD